MQGQDSATWDQLGRTLHWQNSLTLCGDNLLGNLDFILSGRQTTKDLARIGRNAVNCSQEPPQS
jgi:hypothetical protein